MSTRTKIPLSLPSFERILGHKVKLKDAKPEEVFARLNGIFGNVFSESYKSGDHFFGVIVGEKYFFRVNSDIAIIIVVSGQGDSTDVAITSAGGKAGLLRFDWGAHEDFIEIVKKACMQTRKKKEKI
jgi:hypothetical protein